MVPGTGERYAVESRKSCKYSKQRLGMHTFSVGWGGFELRVESNFTRKLHRNIVV